MTTTYQLRVYDGTTLKGIITDMLWLNYAREVNAVGVCQFAVRETNSYAGEIQKNRRVEVWRQPAGAALYKEDTFIVRKLQYVWNGKENVLNVTAVSGNWLLATRYILWKAGTANRSTFDSQKSETVMKNLVKYNMGSDATTANGRIVAGNLSSVTTQADGAGGNTIDWNCAYDNLLTTLQGIANVAGGDFDMVWTGSYWDFRWYAGQLGTDRSAILVFSIDRGNMANPSLTYDWMAEKTLAAIAGQGEGSDRNVRTKTGTDWSSSNQIETFIDARDVETGAANENDLLDKRGDAFLEAAYVNAMLKFDIVQSATSRYGVEYFLGDLGTAVFAIANTTIQISDVKINFVEGQDETVTIGVKNA